MKRHFSNAVNWSALGRLHSIAAVRTMYVWVFVVPIAAKLLEHVSGTVTLNVSATPIKLHLGLPFSWVAFYLSAVSFAIAELIYLLRCPRVVRDQATYTQFRDAGKGVEQLDKYIYEVGLNWEGLRLLLERQDDYFAQEAEAENPPQPDGLLRKRFWATYYHGERERPISRLTCTMLYLSGASLVAYVAAQNLRYVVEYLCLR